MWTNGGLVDFSTPECDRRLEDLSKPGSFARLCMQQPIIDPAPPPKSKLPAHLEEKLARFSRRMRD